MLDPRHVLDHVVRPVLQALNIDSPAAQELLMGTAAQESRLAYLVQLGGGPARGLWQMEPNTHTDIWINWLEFRPATAVLAGRFSCSRAGQPPADEMVWNLRYAAAMCRCHYRRVSEPLPSAGDVAAMAGYWKSHYNTTLGAGTEEEYVKNYALVEDVFRFNAGIA